MKQPITAPTPKGRFSNPQTVLCFIKHLFFAATFVLKSPPLVSRKTSGAINHKLNMDLNTFRKQMKTEVSNNSLLSPNHEQNYLSTAYSGYRTVLSHEAYASLAALINSADYTVHECENQNQSHGSYYAGITPNPSSYFFIAESGVTEHLPDASTVLDSLIVVSGSSQGWHIFGEDSLEIQNKISRGNLIDKGFLR